MEAYGENDPGQDPAAEWLKRVGRGAADWFTPTENKDALDENGQPVVGPRRSKPGADIALDGGRKTDTSASIATGKAGAAAAVEKAHGSSMPAAFAPGASMPPTGPDTAKPAGTFTWGGGRPDWLGKDVEAGASSTAPVTGGTTSTKAPPPDRGTLSYKFGDQPWHQYDADKGGVTMPSGEVQRGGYSPSAVGSNASPEEWRDRVANPGNFEGYADALARPGEDAMLAKERALAEDPFAEERIKTNQALDLERGKAQINRATEEERQGDYTKALSAIAGERDRRLGLLRNSPGYKALDPQGQRAKEAELVGPFQEQLDALQSGTQFGERFAPRASGGFGR